MIVRTELQKIVGGKSRVKKILKYVSHVMICVLNKSRRVSCKDKITNHIISLVQQNIPFICEKNVHLVLTLHV